MEDELESAWNREDWTRVVELDPGRGNRGQHDERYIYARLQLAHDADGFLEVAEEYEALLVKCGADAVKQARWHKGAGLAYAKTRNPEMLWLTYAHYALAIADSMDPDVSAQMGFIMKDLASADVTYAGAAIAHLEQALASFSEEDHPEEHAEVTAGLEEVRQLLFECPIPTLVGAVETSNETLARAFLRAGAAVDEPDVDGCTALHLALAEGQLALAQDLINAGADPLVRDKQGFSLLHWAVFSEKLEALELALSSGCEVDAKDEDERTPLSWAVTSGVHSSVRWLLQQGADANQADNDGWTPLHHAAARGKRAVLDCLVAAGGDLSRRSVGGETPDDVRSRLQVGEDESPH